MSTKVLNLFIRGKNAEGILIGEDEWRQVPIAEGGTIGIDGIGNPIINPPLTYRTNFPLPPAATITVATDTQTITTGVGTEVVARAAKGGVNIKTQVTSPTEGDNAIVTGAPGSGLASGLVNATSQLRFATRVAITDLGTAMFSAGLNQTNTDVDPSGAAGDGAMFLYNASPDDLTTATGLTVAQHANWVLASKVAGVDSYQATNVPVIAGVEYDLVIEIGTDLKADFYINGALVGTGPALTTGATLISMVGIEGMEFTTTQRGFDVRYIQLGRQIG